MTLAADPAATPDDSTTPALRFERLFGLENIGRRWIMPGGATMMAVEAQLKQGVISLDDDNDATLAEAHATGHRHQVEKFRRGLDYARIFNHLNPALRPVQVDWDNWGQLRGFLHGVTSGFNEDDLENWIQGGRYTAECQTLQKRIAAEFYKVPEKSWYPESLREKFSARATPCPPLLLAQMCWFPCAKTIRNIHQQFDRKSALKAGL